MENDDVASDDDLGGGGADTVDFLLVTIVASMMLMVIGSWRRGYCCAFRFLFFYMHMFRFSSSIADYSRDFSIVIIVSAVIITVTSCCFRFCEFFFSEQLPG